MNPNDLVKLCIAFEPSLTVEAAVWSGRDKGTRAGYLVDWCWQRRLPGDAAGEPLFGEPEYQPRIELPARAHDFTVTAPLASLVTLQVYGVTVNGIAGMPSQITVPAVPMLLPEPVKNLRVVKAGLVPVEPAQTVPLTVRASETQQADQGPAPAPGAVRPLRFQVQFLVDTAVMLTEDKPHAIIRGTFADVLEWNYRELSLRVALVGTGGRQVETILRPDTAHIDPRLIQVFTPNGMSYSLDEFFKLDLVEVQPNEIPEIDPTTVAQDLAQQNQS